MLKACVAGYQLFCRCGNTKICLVTFIVVFKYNIHAVNPFQELVMKFTLPLFTSIYNIYIHYIKLYEFIIVMTAS